MFARNCFIPETDQETLLLEVLFWFDDEHDYCEMKILHRCGAVRISSGAISRMIIGELVIGSYLNGRFDGKRKS